MKRIAFTVLALIMMAGVASAQLTFYLVDNFEDGNISKWYVFDNANATVVKNPAADSADSVSEACGEKSLKVTGSASNWYVGGMGTVLDADGSGYTRVMVDVYGSDKGGKLKLELIERDPKASDREIKWTAELPVLGKGFTRYSVPFSAFTLDGAKETVFHPEKGGFISKLQIILIAGSEDGSIDLALDNIIFTF